MKDRDDLNRGSLVDLDRLHLHKWSLSELWTEIGKQEKLKAAQEENIKKNGELFSYLILLLITALIFVPIHLISQHKWNMWLLLPIYLFYLVIIWIIFFDRSGSLKPANIMPPPPRLIDRSRYDPEYYKMLKKWEGMRLEEEFKKIAAEEERKKLEKIEQDKLEEKKRAEELAIKKQLAEAAQAKGEDVCMSCYTINPSRCNCGHCTCYGYCYICDDSGDDD